MLGDLFKAGASMLGLGGGGGRGALGLGLDVFGGNQGDSWGFFGSPIFGNILSSVGGALMAPTSEEQVGLAGDIERRRLAERRRHVRLNYGLPEQYDPKWREKKPGGLMATPPKAGG